MDVKEIYEEILPYLSHPSRVKEFLDEYKESGVQEIMEAARSAMAGSDPSRRTDFRILLNALERYE